jgi:hypothetical protein
LGDYPERTFGTKQVRRRRQSGRFVHQVQRISDDD